MHCYCDLGLQVLFNSIRCKVTPSLGPPLSQQRFFLPRKITIYTHLIFDTSILQHRFIRPMLQPSCPVIGVPRARSSSAVAGTALSEYGRRVLGGSPRCITPNACRGATAPDHTQNALINNMAVRRVTSSIFSGDARFVMSGSDDGNVRIWKAKASEKLGVITARERAAMEYRQSLKDRWRIDGEVDRVARSVCFPSINWRTRSTDRRDIYCV